VEKEAPEPIQLLWQRFWETYFRRYDEIHHFNAEELIKWQIVMVTASLVWDFPITVNDQRISFVKAALRGASHPWFEYR
jgi:hypothetical protein